MPSGDKSYHWFNDLLLVIINVLLVLIMLFTISALLWILYRETYSDISIINLALFIAMVLCSVLVFVFALQDTSISIKFVLVDLVLIISNNIDFIVNNIVKIVSRSKNKTITKED